MMRRGILAAFGLSLVVVTLLSPLPAGADILVYDGGADWSTPGTWFNESLPGQATQAPTVDDLVYVDNRRGNPGIVNISGPGAAMSLRVGELGTGVPSGILTGYGELTVADTLLNNGEVVAYGSGQPRTLDIGSASFVENTADNIPGETRGWTAFQGGRLELPTLSGTTGRWWWGEDPADGDQTPDLINSLRIDAYGSELAPAFHISLLANDRDELPAGTTGTIVGLWDLQAGLAGQQGAWGGEVDLLVRYDDNTLFNLGEIDREEDLRLYHFSDGQWMDVTDSLNVQTKIIGASGIDSFSLFAVGLDIASDGALDPTIPEPASLGLLLAGAAGLGGYLRRRRTR